MPRVPWQSLADGDIVDDRRGPARGAAHARSLAGSHRAVARGVADGVRRRPAAAGHHRLHSRPRPAAAWPTTWRRSSACGSCRRVRAWPAHGPVIEDPIALIDYYVEHRRQREEQVLAALADGLATVEAITARIYAEPGAGADADGARERAGAPGEARGRGRRSAASAVAMDCVPCRAVSRVPHRAEWRDAGRSPVAQHWFDRQRARADCVDVDAMTACRNTTSCDAQFSSRRAILRVPGIVAIGTSRDSSHANATCAGVASTPSRLRRPSRPTGCSWRSLPR